MRYQRVVSLLPGASQTLVALGLEKTLVGVTNDCLPFLNDHETAAVANAQSAQPRLVVRLADRSSETLVREVLSPYAIDLPTLQSLNPDLIITQTQCEATGVSIDEVQAAVNQLTNSRPTILSLGASDLDGVYGVIKAVADTFLMSDKGQKLVDETREKVDRMADEIQTEIDRGLALKKSRVAVLEWLDPLRHAAGWVPQLVEKAHATDVLGKAGRGPQFTSWQAISKADPDVLILAPAGHSIEDTLQVMQRLHHLPDLRTLRAFRDKQVYVVDGSRFFNSMSPAISDTLEILGEILHPAVYKPNRLGVDWVQYF